MFVSKMLYIIIGIISFFKYIKICILLYKVFRRNRKSVNFLKFPGKLDNSVMNKVRGKEENVYKVAFDASGSPGTETERKGGGNKSF